MASAMVAPCEASTSTCRSFVTISSGLYLFLGISVLLDAKSHRSGRTNSMGVAHIRSAAAVCAMTNAQRRERLPSFYRLTLLGQPMLCTHSEREEFRRVSRC